MKVKISKGFVPVQVQEAFAVSESEAQSTYAGYYLPDFGQSMVLGVYNTATKVYNLVPIWMRSEILETKSGKGLFTDVNGNLSYFMTTQEMIDKIDSPTFKKVGWDKPSVRPLRSGEEVFIKLIRTIGNVSARKTYRGVLSKYNLSYEDILSGKLDNFNKFLEDHKDTKVSLLSGVRLSNSNTYQSYVIEEALIQPYPRKPKMVERDDALNWERINKSMDAGDGMLIVNEYEKQDYE